MLASAAKRIKRVFTHLGLAGLSWLIPKKKDYWVCLSLHSHGKYGGSARAVFDYLTTLEGRPNRLDVEYLTSFKDTEARLKKMGLPVRRARFGWLLPVLRAEVVITDNYAYFLGLGNYNIAQLWHGTGYKNIALSDEHAVQSNFKLWLHKRYDDNTLFIAAASEEDRVRKSLAFRSEKVVVTGSPRTDSLIRADQTMKLEKSLAPRQTRFLYAPTFRDRTSNKPFMPQEWLQLDTFLASINATLDIKRHPNDLELNVPKELRRIRDITHDTEDVQAILLEIDALISDYSGIASDFVLLDKPMIFYIYDFEEYLVNNRTFYYDVLNFLPGPFASNPADLQSLLSNLDWFNDPEYRSRFLSFRNRTNRHTDGLSSKRVVQTIAAKLMNPG